MVYKKKEGFEAAKDIKDVAKFTYQCLESGDDKDRLMTLGKANLVTPWGKMAENEMELPFRVVYSEDRYMPEGQGGAREEWLEKEPKGTIEIGFRGTALELKRGGLVDKAKGMEQALFDTFYLKMPLGGGTMPFGPRRLFRYSDELRDVTAGRELPCCCGFQEYCLAGCVAALDGCTTFLCWPCNNVNDTHGFYDWHQAALIQQYGMDGVTASVHSGFYAAAMSTVPTVEQMLNAEFGIERDEFAEKARMVCCAPQKGCARCHVDPSSFVPPCALVAPTRPFPWQGGYRLLVLHRLLLLLRPRRVPVLQRVTRMLLERLLCGPGGDGQHGQTLEAAPDRRDDPGDRALPWRCNARLQQSAPESLLPGAHSLSASARPSPHACSRGHSGDVGRSFCFLPRRCYRHHLRAPPRHAGLEGGARHLRQPARRQRFLLFSGQEARAQQCALRQPWRPRPLVATARVQVQPRGQEVPPRAAERVWFAEGPAWFAEGRAWFAEGRVWFAEERVCFRHGG